VGALMNTKISQGNPFKYTRHGFAFEHICNGNVCLDYGCYDGSFIKTVLEYKNVTFVGADKNRQIVSENPHSLKIVHTGNQLPFVNDSFDCITMLDVLEHIYDQKGTLREINRVLRRGGTLIVTVPRKHVFSLLDLKNLSFTFPRISKRFLCLIYTKEKYFEWFVKNPDGLVGDVEKEKSWHDHFSPQTLENLLKRHGFGVVAMDGSGLFQRVFILFDFLKIGRVFPRSLRHLDCKNFEYANLFCKAVKLRNIEN
jgi:ubiquinone/menaquinone biosynthesis C-methylase UbiE